MWPLLLCDYRWQFVSALLLPIQELLQGYEAVDIEEEDVKEVGALEVGESNASR